MIIDLSTATEVFRKIHQIREEYRAAVLNGDTHVISIEDLQWIIEHMYDVKIEKLLVPFEGQFIRGTYERWPDKVRVYVKQEQPFDWHRFTATKEMCHCVIDEKEDWSTDGVETLQDLLNEITIAQEEMPTRQVQSEFLAEIAAVELLYPFDCRAYDKERIAKNELSVVKIATHHGLPAPLVSRSLSNSHLEFCGRVWEEVKRIVG